MVWDIPLNKQPNNITFCRPKRSLVKYISQLQKTEETGSFWKNIPL